MTWISAGEAIELMNVRAQTLYANVSRGKIRAKADSRDPRRRIYHRDDVLRLAGRRRGKRAAESVATEALDWGTPVLPSAVSTVQSGWLWYRGQDAMTLARSSHLEDIAGLLWETDPVNLDMASADITPPARGSELASALSMGLAAMAARSVTDLPTLGRSAATLKVEAAEVLRTLVCAMFGAARLQAGGRISAQIAANWRRPRAEPAIRRALCLVADHELNASTFAARVTISTGASLSAGVLTGLATLTGPLHGRAGIALRPVIDAVARAGAQVVVRERLRQGLDFPAFGHPLYPDGDPRALALLDMLTVPAEFRDLAHWIERLAGDQPNIDFALAALGAAHRLPAEAPIALFAVGRCVGWLAHALEQAQSGHLIRPRARYVGPRPPAHEPAKSR